MEDSKKNLSDGELEAVAGGGFKFPWSKSKWSPEQEKFMMELLTGNGFHMSQDDAKRLLKEYDDPKKFLNDCEDDWKDVVKKGLGL